MENDQAQAEPVIIWYPNANDPSELEQVTDETIAMLIEKLAEGERYLLNPAHLR